MRLFVALELPRGLRALLAERVAAVRPELPAARWVRPEAVHLTLVFLGETAAERVPELTRGLAAACAPTPPQELRAAGAGTFPPRRPARVAWVGLAAGDELGALQGRVRTASEAALDRELERRVFHPHLTLGRPRRPWPRGAVERWGEALSGPVGRPFVADEAVLFRSHLEPAGARHEALARFPLTGEG